MKILLNIFFSISMAVLAASQGSKRPHPAAVPSLRPLARSTQDFGPIGFIQGSWLLSRDLATNPFWWKDRQVMLSGNDDHDGEGIETFERKLSGELRQALSRYLRATVVVSTPLLYKAMQLIGTVFIDVRLAWQQPAVVGAIRSW
ncbi:hypothetical protein [Rhizobium azibense]|nr:hypothetical protein [Rhizobium azibense]